TSKTRSEQYSAWSASSACDVGGSGTNAGADCVGQAPYRLETARMLWMFFEEFATRIDESAGFSQSLFQRFGVRNLHGGVGLGLHQPREIDAELVLQHPQHGGHAAADGAHHLANAAGAVRAVAHFDDVDLVDAGQLRRERLRELRHFLDDHV